ncbi:MAG: 16S rRNA (cytosine(1402)-N(4))-methyltransferase RsmH [Oscillospiraceae bacterium]|nr:16S rRNA (cytosine(1402)-N(4))-methyltransferase RsmH [Oscillospiraceae bacterium]
MSGFNHTPVMLSECIEGLDIKPHGTYFDLTAGGAGHSAEIAKRLTTGRLIAIDRDPDAVAEATSRLAPYSQAQVIHSNYCDTGEIAKTLGIDSVDGFLLDLGVSSFQLDNAHRGFSYNNDGPLDMRMSKDGISAEELLATLSADKLTSILRRYGQERFARQIAQAVIKKRSTTPIKTTAELAEIVAGAVPAKFRREKNPCKRAFMAIRIAINRELEVIEPTLDTIFGLLSPGGRIAVITFHGIEDKIVKHRLDSFCKGCTCPSSSPVCICGKIPQAAWISKRAIKPSDRELAANRRSESAKLRIIKRM